MELTITVARVAWRPCFRIIPSRFPPIALFERIADPADYDALIALESMTNPRWREEVGQIALVPPEDRVGGPGASVIMAAFTHPNPDGSRFSDGTRGVFYAARTIETAIAETRHHRERFMRATRQPRMELDMRAYRVDLDADLYDIRGRQQDFPLVYDRDEYAAGQQLARRLSAAGADGIVYHSVRHPGGECAAAFRPRLLANVRQERHLCYVWNGERIETVYEKRTFDA